MLQEYVFYILIIGFLTLTILGMLALVILLPYGAYRAVRYLSELRKQPTDDPESNAPDALYIAVPGNGENAAYVITLNSNFGNLTRKQRKAILRSAKQEYKESRGYAHRQLMLSVQKKYEARHAEIAAELSNIEGKVSQLNRERIAALQAALERHLIQTKLSDVSGIGGELRRRIIAEIRPSRLDDLQMAYVVRGVGETKQFYINHWIDQMKAEIPGMMQQPFAGRYEVEPRFDDRQQTLMAKKDAYRREASAIMQKQETLEPHYQRLAAIDRDIFVEAAKGNGAVQKEIDIFLTGAFPEWEPVPNWFKDVVADYDT